MQYIYIYTYTICILYIQKRCIETYSVVCMFVLCAAWLSSTRALVHGNQTIDWPTPTLYKYAYVGTTKGGAWISSLTELSTHCKYHHAAAPIQNHPAPATKWVHVLLEVAVYLSRSLSLAKCLYIYIYIYIYICDIYTYIYIYMDIRYFSTKWGIQIYVCAPIHV